VTIIKVIISLTLLILQNGTLKLSQFTLLLMVVKFVNVQGIKLLYYFKKVHLLSKLLAIYWHVNVVLLLTTLTTEYKHVQLIRLAQDRDHLCVLLTFIAVIYQVRNYWNS
jgi:hypothetical protein